MRETEPSVGNGRENGSLVGPSPNVALVHGKAWLTIVHPIG
jgi:hypothetical protein